MTPGASRHTHALDGVTRFPRGWLKDPAVMKVVREHARGEHKAIRLDCPVCRRFPGLQS